MEVWLYIIITSELSAVVSFPLRSFYPEEIRYQYPLYRRSEFIPEAIRTRSQRKNVLKPTWTKPWSCSQHADHYVHRMVIADAMYQSTAPFKRRKTPSHVHDTVHKQVTEHCYVPVDINS